MASANEAPSPTTPIANPERDYAADSDDSLSRKKQRMSEEPEPLIESLDPEDIGGNLDNAITIEDDTGSDLFPPAMYSDTLDIFSSNLSPTDQLKKFANYIDSQYYVETVWLLNLTTWLNDHIESTSSERRLWQRRYLEDEAFFSMLAVTAVRLLSCSDIVDAKYPNQRAMDATLATVLDLYKGLAKLSLRMLSFLPSLLDGVVARRDSTQPTIAGVQRVPFLWYIFVLGKLLDPRTPSSRHFVCAFGLDVPAITSKVAEFVLADRTSIASLNTALRSLSTRPRDYEEAWPGITGSIAALALSMQKAEKDFHTGSSNKQVMELILTVNEYIVPTVCQKHPRALPADFHDDLVLHVSSLIACTVGHRDATSTLDVYQTACRPNGDNIAAGLTEGEATEIKLLEACSHDQGILAELIKDLWLLQTLKGYVSTDILDIRSKGIVSLRELLKSAFNTYVIRQKGPNVPQDTSHPVLRYLASFLRKGDFVEYIFSADSHANLVKECSDVVGFLAATSTYSDHESDLIWRAATTSVEVEFVKASFDVLRTMSVYMEPVQLLYIVGKYRETPAAQLGTFAVAFLGDVLTTIRSKLYDSKDSALTVRPAQLCFDILKALDLDTPAPFTQSFRRGALSHIIEVASSKNEFDHRAALYDTVLAEVKGHTVHSTTALETLSHLLKLRPFDATERILEKFSVTDAVDELANCVRNAGSASSGNLHDLHSAVQARLQIALRLIGISEESEGSKVEEKLWAYAVGEHALDSLARESALDTFISVPTEVARPQNIRSLFNRCTNEYLPTMSVECATMRLVTFLHQSAKQEWDSVITMSDSDEATLRLWTELVRIAATSPSDAIAGAATKAICDILFSATAGNAKDELETRRVSFVRQHLNYLCSLREKEHNVESCQALTLRGISILEAMHAASQTLTTNNRKGSDEATIDLSGDDDESELCTLRMLVHGPSSTPKIVNIHCRSSCTATELNSAFAKVTGVNEHDIMHNGSLFRLAEKPTATLADLGIVSLNSIIVRPRFIVTSDFGSIFASTDAIERKVLEKFDELKALLSGDEKVGEKMFNFLATVSPPTTARRQVVSPEGGIEGTSPPGGAWQTMYSVHVLNVQLHDCNSLGVADKGFILHGARMLSELLLDTTRAPSHRLLSKTLMALRNFLQGTPHGKRALTPTNSAEADPITERPQESPPPPYLETPAPLALRLFDIIGELMAAPMEETLTGSTSDPMSRAELVKLAYTAFLDIARTEDVWQDVEHTKQFADIHEKLLLNNGMRVSIDISLMVEAFVKETPSLAAPAFLRTVMALLPAALRHDGMLDAFFTVYRATIMHNIPDEAQLRKLIATLTRAVWQYKHAESPDLPVLDRTFAGLLGALRDTVNVLKSLKKPMHLGALGGDILRCLLLTGDGSGKTPSPEVAGENYVSPANTATSLTLRPHDTEAAAIKDGSSEPVVEPPKPEPPQMTVVSPLIHPYSRAICFEMVSKTCESVGDYEWIVEQMILNSDRGERAAGRFPSGSWLRETGACAGLTNLGMTCYMNSLLQQMFSNIELRNCIFSIPITNSENQGFLLQVQKLFAHMQAYDAPFAETHELAKYLGCDVNNQEDVHGFYNDFIGKLERCIPEPQARKAFSRMFSGKLIMQIQGSCGHVSSKADPFSDISLTVQNKTSLAESLSEYVQGEPMQGANKYKCLSCDGENGGKLVDAMKRECLEEVPDHLTVCLKRCTFDMLGQESKINDYFEFPEEIDMSKYELEYLQSPGAATRSDMFRLVGVIVHSGILSFGHYWSYVLVRGFEDPKAAYWVRLEDRAHRRAAGFEEIRNECFGGSNRAHNGYVLFYQRQASFERAAESAVKLPRDASILPPRAALPPKLAQHLHDCNVIRHRSAQLFENEYHGFTLKLLQDPDELASASAKADASDVAKTEKDSNSDTSDPPMPNGLNELLAKLVHSYLVHVTLSEKLPNKTAELRDAFCRKASSRPGLARALLSCICNDEHFFDGYMAHAEGSHKSEVRIFVLNCLNLTQEQEPELFPDVVKQLVSAHVSRLPQIESADGWWFEYFCMAWDITRRGSDERHIVSQAPYLNFICEAVNAGLNRPTALSSLRELVRKGKTFDWYPLLEYIKVFFSAEGALDNSDDFSNGRYADASGLVELVNLRDGTRYLPWVLLAVNMDMLSPHNVHTWAPAKIVGEFARSQDWRLGDAVYQSLIYCCAREVPVRSLIAMIHAYVAARPQDDAEAVQLMRCFAQYVMDYDVEARAPIRDAIDFFSEAFPVIPMAIMSTMPALGEDWLMPDRRVPKTSEAWFRKYLLDHDPLHRLDGSDRYGTDIDVLRSSTIRRLVNRCSPKLTDHVEMYGTVRAPQMLSVMRGSYQYLAGLVQLCQSVQNAPDENDAQLSLDMVVEFREAHRAVRDLGLLLRRWQTGAEEVLEEIEYEDWEDSDSLVDTEDDGDELRS